MIDHSLTEAQREHEAVQREWRAQHLARPDVTNVISMSEFRRWAAMPHMSVPGCAVRAHLYVDQVRKLARDDTRRRAAIAKLEARNDARRAKTKARRPAKKEADHG